ncbi:ABC transporter ATP-binding protein [Candidatus Poribacteria bacterium]|nr:ABC transporter ATP-binding protein [Candidatus Poribacteria bacterium]
MLEIRHLSKDYDGFDAVMDLNLSIPQGEFFCFLGPNGAGKTTTIKTVTGLLRPTQGSVSIDGRDIQQDPIEARRRIGYIPDTPYLYEKLSGREFLNFVADLYNVPADVRQEGLEKYFTHFGLIESADKLIENYSHGMRQKLCFSVALMHKPKLLVVDEPMVGLDPRSARTLKNLLREFCAGGGTIFLSTHLLSLAEELADRIGIITKGRLQFLGTTPELRRQLAREGNLEELFLQLTEDGCTDSPDVFGGDEASGEGRVIAIGR